MKEIPSNVSEIKSQDCLLEMCSLTKSFPGVLALDDVSLKITKGEVHAISGENGAGKSTLMKIINGQFQPDQGLILIEGCEARIGCPAESLKLGISMIHQELSPFAEMTVAENLFMGREIKKGLFLNKMEMNRRTKKYLQEFQLDIESTQKVKTLNIAQTQMLEIIKAVSYNSKLIIMDEPTSSLSDSEVSLLFNTIKDLKEKGTSVIYITHRLEEIFEIADRVSVLRDGKYIGTEAVKEVTTEQLINMMVGREVVSLFPKEETNICDVALECRGIKREKVFEDISFSVRKGEILGLCGLVGAGRSEVARAIFGLDKCNAGEIFVEGEKVNIKKPLDAIKLGISFLSEDRKLLGLVLCRSVRENIALTTLKKHNNRIFLHKKKEKERCGAIVNKLSVRTPNIETVVNSLSGGNQQKVVIAKWLLTEPKILILDEPTRGIDVGAKAEIHKIMNDLAKRGIAIILISSELPEIMAMSDRIIIMGQGRIKGEYLREEIVSKKVTQENILHCALAK